MVHVRRQHFTEVQARPRADVVHHLAHGQPHNDVGAPCVVVPARGDEVSGRVRLAVAVVLREQHAALGGRMRVVLEGRQRLGEAAHVHVEGLVPRLRRHGVVLAGAAAREVQRDAGLAAAPERERLAAVGHAEPRALNRTVGAGEAGDARAREPVIAALALPGARVQVAAGALHVARNAAPALVARAHAAAAQAVVAVAVAGARAHAAAAGAFLAGGAEVAVHADLAHVAGAAGVAQAHAGAAGAVRAPPEAAARVGGAAGAFPVAGLAVVARLARAGAVAGRAVVARAAAGARAGHVPGAGTGWARLPARRAPEAGVARAGGVGVAHPVGVAWAAGLQQPRARHRAVSARPAVHAAAVAGAHGAIGAEAVAGAHVLLEHGALFVAARAPPVVLAGAGP